MPQDKLDLYIRSSIEYENAGHFDDITTAKFKNGTKMFSHKCISIIKELYCLSFYCSDDEKQIVTQYSFEDCEDTIKQW